MPVQKVVTDCLTRQNGNRHAGRGQQQHIRMAIILQRVMQILMVTV